MEKQRDLFCGLTYTCYNRLGYFIMKFKVVAHNNTMACGIRTYHKAIYMYIVDLHMIHICIACMDL